MNLSQRAMKRAAIALLFCVAILTVPSCSKDSPPDKDRPRTRADDDKWVTKTVGEISLRVPADWSDMADVPPHHGWAGWIKGKEREPEAAVWVIRTKSPDRYVRKVRNVQMRPMTVAGRSAVVYEGNTPPDPEGAGRVLVVVVSDPGPSDEKVNFFFASSEADWIRYKPIFKRIISSISFSARQRPNAEELPTSFTFGSQQTTRLRFTLTRWWCSKRLPYALYQTRGDSGLRKEGWKLVCLVAKYENLGPREATGVPGFWAHWEVRTSEGYAYRVIRPDTKMDTPDYYCTEWDPPKAKPGAWEIGSREERAYRDEIKRHRLPSTLQPGASGWVLLYGQVPQGATPVELVNLSPGPYGDRAVRLALPKALEQKPSNAPPKGFPLSGQEQTPSNRDHESQERTTISGGAGHDVLVKWARKDLGRPVSLAISGGEVYAEILSRNGPKIYGLSLDLGETLRTIDLVPQAHMVGVSPKAVYISQGNVLSALSKATSGEVWSKRWGKEVGPICVTHHGVFAIARTEAGHAPAYVLFDEATGRPAWRIEDARLSSYCGGGPGGRYVKLDQVTISGSSAPPLPLWAALDYVRIIGENLLYLSRSEKRRSGDRIVRLCVFDLKTGKSVGSSVMQTFHKRPSGEPAGWGREYVRKILSQEWIPICAAKDAILVKMVRWDEDADRAGPRLGMLVANDLMWKSPPIAGMKRPSLVAATDKVLTIYEKVSHGGTLYGLWHSLDLHTGRIVWKHWARSGTSKELADDLFFNGMRPGVVCNNVIVCASGTHVVLLDPLTGRILAKPREFIPVDDRLVVAHGDLVVIGTESGLSAFRVAFNDGQSMDRTKELGNLPKAEVQSNAPQDDLSRPLAKQDLIDELAALRRIILKKIDNELSDTAVAFTSVKAYRNARRVADVIRPFLRGLQGILSVLAKARDAVDVKKQLSSELNGAESVCQLASLFMLYNGLQESGEQFYVSLFGPGYATSIEEMLNAADAVKVPFKKFNEDLFRQVIENHLNGTQGARAVVLVPRKSTLVSERRGAEGVMAVRSAIARELDEVAKEVQASRLPPGFPMEDIVSNIRIIRQGVAKSLSSSTEINYRAFGPSAGRSGTRERVSLGAMAELQKAFGVIASAIAENTQLEINAEWAHLTQAGADAAYLYVSYKLPGLKDAAKVTQYASMAPGIVIEGRKRLRTNATEEFYFMPQTMAFSLSVELSHLWKIADDITVSVRTLLGQRDKQFRKVARPVPGGQRAPAVGPEPLPERRRRPAPVPTRGLAPHR